MNSNDADAVLVVNVPAERWCSDSARRSRASPSDPPGYGGSVAGVVVVASIEAVICLVDSSSVMRLSSVVM